jgi:hypothetical protein
MAHPKNYDRVFTMTFASVYVHYLAKVLKKIAPKKNLIPRYVLFGKDGTILHKDAPRPSSPDIEKLLQLHL